jgi:hypothetical protein
MFLVIVNKALKSSSTRLSAKQPGIVIHSALLACLSLPMTAFAVCPDLTSYYQAPGQVQWPDPEVFNQLTGLMPECLESAEYFALLGAAQLNSGSVLDALESLERAILLDPDNGGARIDYAEALYVSGQLFPALEINQSLLQRSDLPPNLVGVLQTREEQWRAQTRSKGLFVELAAGYDNNLNGAPSKNDFTLTLAGEPVSFALSPDFQAASGGYINMQLAGFYQRLDPDHSQDLQFGLRSRQSDQSSNELLQFDWRYSYVLPVRTRQWEFAGGSSHLMFGGNPLYSITEGRVRYRFRESDCNAHYELAAQHQLYHGQSPMTGIESSAGAGFECLRGIQRLGIETGIIYNSAVNNRPGADRQGWRMRLNWQLQLGQDAINAQFVYASLDDDEGYSPLLENNATRQVDSRTVRVQYIHPFESDLSLIINLNHQGQGSNIDPFENHSTAFEVGFRLGL